VNQQISDQCCEQREATEVRKFKEKVWVQKIEIINQCSGMCCEHFSLILVMMLLQFLNGVIILTVVSINIVSL